MPTNNRSRHKLNFQHGIKTVPKVRNHPAIRRDDYLKIILIEVEIMQGKPKRNLTIKEHRDLGKKITKLRRELREIFFILQDTHPKKSRVITRIISCQKLLDQLRDMLEDEMFYENYIPREKQVPYFNIYYPKK
jgi:hypothetical protein